MSLYVWNDGLHPGRLMPSCTWMKYSPQKRVLNTDILYYATNAQWNLLYFFFYETFLLIDFVLFCTAYTFEFCLLTETGVDHVKHLAGSLVLCFYTSFWAKSDFIKAFICVNFFKTFYTFIYCLVNKVCFFFFFTSCSCHFGNKDII